VRQQGRRQIEPQFDLAGEEVLDGFKVRSYAACAICSPGTRAPLYTSSAK